MMKTSRKINILRAFCILTIGALSFIQYYLVKNTYQLTKEKYYSEVQLAIDKIRTHKVVADAEAKEIEKLKELAWQYLDKTIAKEEFVRSFKFTADSARKVLDPFVQKQIKAAPILGEMKYRFDFVEVLLIGDQKADTLLSASSKPIVFFGQSFKTSGQELIASSVSEISREKKTESKRYRRNDSSLLKIKNNQYVDINTGKFEIFKRMAMVFFIASGLMLAVIFLFYIIFKIMLRERKISEMKTDFANNITHELKTPLASVNLILKTLNRDEIDADQNKRKELLKTLERQYHKIHQLVDSVLESSMADFFKLELKKNDIGDYLNQYVKEHPYPILAEIDSNTIFLEVNTAAIDKVLNNLIENAIKYGAPGASIELRSYVMKNAYFIEVIDRGIGIDTAYLPYIFDKFYRVPEKNVHSSKGLGIGLYLSKQAVEQMGGTITVKSKVNEGSSFIIKLLIHEN